MRKACQLAFVVLLVVSTVLLLSECTPLRGDNDEPVLQQSPPGGPNKAQQDIDKPPSKQEIDEAIKKGTKWLLRQRNDDGSFKGKLSRSYPMGMTALCLLALLKSGVDRKHPAIKKGFAYITDLPLERTYEVTILMMALEARYEPAEPGKNSKTPLSEITRRRMSSKARKWLRYATKWLISHQQKNIWRYPYSGEDVSCTQYALLGLNTALRMKIKVPGIVFKKASDYFVEYQGKAKEEFTPPFRVPAADFSIEQLRELEKDYYRRLTNLAKAKNSPKKEQAKRGPTTELVEEDPYRRFGIEEKKFRMYPRGWQYNVWEDAKEGRLKTTPITGSMTAAGMACLIICKAGLHGSKHWTKEYAEQVNQSIRDGAAWVAKYFTVDHNPYEARRRVETNNTLYYYLYGLERAGVLALVRSFGEHNWYAKGARFLLDQQEPQGYWEEKKTSAAKGSAFRLCDTCFALLFLKRATNPIVSVPEDGGESIYTGEDLFKKKEKEADGQNKP